MWEVKTLHEQLNLISSYSVLVPSDKGDFVDGKQCKVCALQQSLAVKKTSPHGIVCTQNQLESGSVPLTSRFSSWVGKLVTKLDANCLYKSTFGWIMSWTPC